MKLRDLLEALHRMPEEALDLPVAVYDESLEVTSLAHGTPYIEGGGLSDVDGARIGPHVCIDVS